MLSMSPKVIIIFGPPGSGKGTQAQILAEKYDLFHLETSKVIEEALKDPTTKETLEINGHKFSLSKERKIFNEGKLNTPALVLFLITKKIEGLAQKGKSVVFSGSPRTMSEAETIIPLLSSLYGIENIKLVFLNVPEDASIFRNSNRRICEICRTPIPFSPNTEIVTQCTKCGGRLIKRGQIDTPKVIKVRLKEYKERTEPIVKYFEERGGSVERVDGLGSIAEVSQRISKALGLN